jgi:hypothetical protein
LYLEDGSEKDTTLGYIIFVSNKKYLADHTASLFGSSN